MGGVRESQLTRRTLLLGLAGASATLAVGCRPAAVGERIVLASKISELGDLHPFTAKSSRALALLNHISDGLTKFRPDFSVGPGLAQSWEVDKDGQAYTFKLRSDASWHDGRPFTPEDVQHTFDAVRAKGAKATSAAVFATYVKDVWVSGDSVRIALAKPYAPLLAVLAGQLPMLPAHLTQDVYAPAFSARPVGTGPYKLTDRDNSTVTVEAHDGYWGEPALEKKIILFDSPEPSAQMAGLLTQEIDVVEYDSTSMSGLEKRGPSVVTGVAGSVHGICLDLKNPALADVRVRRALRLALDRDRIRALHYPKGTPAEGLVSPAFEGFTANLDAIPRDPAAAERLLDEAGWTRSGDTRRKGGDELRIMFHAWPAKQWQDMAALAQANWREIGVAVDIVAVENARTASTLSARFDAAPLGWGLTGEPSIGLNLLLHSTDKTFSEGGTYNVFHFSDAHADTLIEKSLAETDLGKRQALIRELQQIAYDQVPFIPIAFPAYQLAARVGVSVDETGAGHLSGVGQSWFMNHWRRV